MGWQFETGQCFLKGWNSLFNWQLVLCHSGSVITCVRSCCPLAQSTGTPSFKVSGYSGHGQLKSNSIYLNYIRYIKWILLPAICSQLSLYVSLFKYIYIYIYIFCGPAALGEYENLVLRWKSSREIYGNFILLQEICKIASLTLETWGICKLLFESSGQFDEQFELSPTDTCFPKTSRSQPPKRIQKVL